MYFDNYKQSVVSFKTWPFSNFNLEYELSLSNRSSMDVAVKLGEQLGTLESYVPGSRRSQ